MAGDSIPAGQTFSTTVGLLYVFNLIVGTGALALPHALQSAGYLLSIVLLLISAFTSYVCATFVLESMAIANCVLKRRRTAAANDFFTVDVLPPPNAVAPVPPPSLHGAKSSAPQFASPASPHDFNISQRVEVSEMAQLFLGKTGVLFSYVILVIYLFGDMSVYSTTVPKSLMNVICSSLLNTSVPANELGPCHTGANALLHSLSRLTVYRLCILAFLVFCFPLILMGMTRTKWLQLATTMSRWTAFLLMIVLASVRLVQNGPQGAPVPADFHGFGSLFGVAVYAFMCHHSIPGLVTPIRNKSYLNAKLSSIYVLVYLFYAALSMTGAFAFAHVQDIYTINFLHSDQGAGILSVLLNYFLALFPVFVITSSYIIVAITLCNNIRALGTLLMGKSKGKHENRSSLCGLFDKYGVPFCVVVVPACVSVLVNNVTLLASITGSFPGVGVQFVLPVLLLFGARRTLASLGGCRVSVPAQVRSPFAHWIWPAAIMCWSCVAVGVVVMNFCHWG